MEYSWKWNTSTSEPEIRYSWEAFNPGNGRTSDPLNQALSLDYMQQVPHVIPDVDFTWARHFLQEIESGDREASNFLHAVEYHRTKRFTLKSYFLPRNVKLLEGGDPTTMKEWDDAILKLDPKNESRDTLMDFLTNNSEGKLMTPAYVEVVDTLNPRVLHPQQIFLG